MRAVPVVKADVKPIEIFFATCGDIGHKLLGRFASFFSRNHDRRTVCVICAHEIDLVALHPLKTNPDIGLDIFHDVADVEFAVGIRQGRRYE
jgi:hypothetical protein